MSPQQVSKFVMHRKQKTVIVAALGSLLVERIKTLEIFWSAYS